jgi:hypothetical protein
MSAWQRVVDPLVFVGNDAGGDTQFTEGFGARWIRRIVYGVDPIAKTFPEYSPDLWAVVDSTYYGSRNTDTDDPDVIEACYELTVCGDPVQPGDTEAAAWTEYDDVESGNDVDCSDDALQQYATDDEAPTDVWWNEAMDRQNGSSSFHYYLAVTG